MAKGKRYTKEDLQFTEIAYDPKVEFQRIAAQRGIEGARKLRAKQQQQTPTTQVASERG